MRFPNWLDWWLIKEGRAKKRSLTGNQTGQKFDLGVPVSKTIRKQMFIVDSTQPAVFCYGSLSSLVQWVPRCYCCCWSRDHFENRGCGQWKPVKVPAVFLSTFTITVFFFFFPVLDPVSSARKGQPRIIEKPGHFLHNEWVPSAYLALSFTRFALLLVEVNAKDLSISLQSWRC